MCSDRDRMLTFRSAAKIAGVSYDTIIAWVNWKDIQAVNVAKKQGGRAWWRIALTKFPPIGDTKNAQKGESSGLSLSNE